MSSHALAWRPHIYLTVALPAAAWDGPPGQRQAHLHTSKRATNSRVPVRFWVSLSLARIVLEHAIAGVKRCRIVKDVLRLTTEGITDWVMEIDCGLRNLRVSCPHSLPAFDLRSLMISG